MRLFSRRSDPFALGKPAEYLQFDLDSLDGSAAKNPSGNVIGKLKKADSKPKARTLVVRTLFERLWLALGRARDGTVKILCISWRSRGITFRAEDGSRARRTVD